jgi:hypothetical protein
VPVGLRTEGSIGAVEIAEDGRRSRMRRAGEQVERASLRIREGSAELSAAGGLSVALVVSLWLAVVGAGAQGREVEPSPGDSRRLPVVFVPGVTGVELRDAETHDTLWGRGTNLLFPRDRGYATARALQPGPSRSSVEAGEVILRLRLAGVVRKPIYQPLVDLLESHGYRLGDLAAPQPGDSLFLFGYDWRQGNVESAHQLLDRLLQLRQVRGEEHLSVVLVCQSNGAHLCRYLARYGAATLEQAEAGRGVDLPSTLDLRKIVLMGASNGGSIRILRELNRGRRYIPWVGRRWSPETLFTFESLYQDLPASTDDLFVDAEGRRLEVDLYDVASWKRYGWSIYSRRVAERLASGAQSELFGDADQRQAFLACALRRARLFQALLHQDAGGASAGRYYLLANDSNETPVRAVLLEESGGWETYFLGDSGVDRLPPLAGQLAASGDGHATIESQMWLSKPELELLAPQVMRVGGRHFEMIHAPGAQRHLLEILADEVP